MMLSARSMPSSAARRALDALLIVVTVCYPFSVYFTERRVSAGWSLAVLLVVIVLRAGLFLASGRRLAGILALGVAAALAGFHQLGQLDAVRLYPVLVNLVFTAVFGATLVFPPSLIERLARLREPDLDAYGVQYTRRLTLVWVVFFILNAGLCAWAGIAWPTEYWALYTGLVSYLLVGALFVGEWPVRRYCRRRHEKRAS